uniref:Dual oxidase maturation factor 1-like n=1 Tax=Nothoprocta perdicaria TaxID=30464 RepID=A0A8C6Z0Q9_NOTPE
MTPWDGSFPFYPNVNTYFPFDTTQAVIISVFFSALATCIIILPGIRGRGRFFWLLRGITGLFIGAVVLSEDWENGWVTANTSYKSFSRAMVNADIGLHIGLAGVNITFVGNPVNQVNETINYNEHFAWSFDADYDRSYSEGLEKGLPSPILYVAEKFTSQSPCGVHNPYRISGRYASLTLWMAFCTWVLATLLFSMPILLYGGYMLLLTAALMLFSLFFLFTVRNTPNCPIQFGPASLKTAYGGSFWLTLTTGLLCLLLGLGVIVLNSVHPEKLKLLFNLDDTDGKGEAAEGWEKSHLPTDASASEQEMLTVPLSELCEVTVTKL